MASSLGNRDTFSDCRYNGFPMAFISAKRPRVRSIRFLPGFFYYALISTFQARKAPQEAHRRMVAEGRPSKVNHPSPDHQAIRIPSPRTGTR